MLIIMTLSRMDEDIPVVPAVVGMAVVGMAVVTGTLASWAGFISGAVAARLDKPEE